MKIRLKTESAYKAYVFLLIAIYMFETSSIPGFSESFVHDILQILALMMVAIYITQKKYSVMQLMGIFVLSFIGILCYISSGLSGLLMTVLAIVLMPKNYLDSTLKMILKEEIVLFCVIIALSFIGVLSQGSTEVAKGYYTTNAVSLGFTHPNMLAAQGTSIVLLYLCINRYNLKVRHYIVAIISMIALFLCSKGRTGAILGFFSILLLQITKNQKIKSVFLRILPYTYVCIIVLWCVFMFLYARDGGTSSLSVFVNDRLFNGRVGLAFRSLLVYPITAFGKAIDISIWNPYQYYALDNGQIMVLLEFGIVGFIAYYYIIQKTLNEIKQENEIVLGIAFFIFLIWSMYEGTMYFVGKNYTLLFLGVKGLSGMLNFKNRGKSYDS